MVLYTGILGCANRLCSLYLRTLPGTKFFIFSIVYLKFNANSTFIFPILLPVVIYIYIYFLSQLKRPFLSFGTCSIVLVQEWQYFCHLFDWQPP